MRNVIDHQDENERQLKKKKKANKNTYDIFSIKCSTRKFREVLRCSHTKQRQRNVQKECAARATLLFHRSRCLRRLAFHDFLFCLSKL